MRSGLPYKVIGGTRFYDRREIKDAMAYLRAVVNPVDEVSVKRVLNAPKRGIGDSTIGRLDAFARAHGLTFVDALRRCDEAEVSGKAFRGIDAFVELIDSMQSEVEKGPAVAAREGARPGRATSPSSRPSTRSRPRAGSRTWPSSSASPASSRRSTSSSSRSASSPTPTQLEDDDDSSVMLMTLHSAKGLEFPAVFLIGMEEGVFPHLRTLAEPDQLEEERRLAYVGITRAERACTSARAWSRMLHGSTQYNPPSRFLDEIPADLVEEIGGGSRGRRRGSFGGRGQHLGLGVVVGVVVGAPGEYRAVEHRERRVQDALTSSGPSQSGADALGLRVGDDVRHAKWGEGVILDIRGEGDKAEATVRFPSAGEKVLLLAWAPLEKV